MRRGCGCPAVWASTRRRCAGAWWREFAPAASTATRCCRRWPRSSATASSTARWRPRPTKTPACRSACSKRSPSRRWWRGCWRCCSTAKPRAPRATWGGCSKSAPAAATRRSCWRGWRGGVVSTNVLRPLHDKARANALPLGGDGVCCRRRPLGHAHGAVPQHRRRGGGDALPPAWLEQLAPAGASWRDARRDTARRPGVVVVDRRGDGYVTRTHDAVHFVPLESGTA